jgi:hypothetical protein
VLQHKADIDALHDAAGILLHIENEKSGHADVHLTRGQLKEIATKHLISQTYSDLDAAEGADKIIGLATDRLILLVESSANKWGFEVRSFQEFMASRYLTKGLEAEIIARLRLLAGSSHWRNTWLFAAAEVFGNRPHLRAQILSIVQELDDHTMAEHLAKPGSVLAADMVMDNFAGDTPRYKTQLLNQVLEILDTPLLDQHVVPILHEAAESDPVIRRKIEERFNDALAAGGARKWHMERLMQLWSKRFTGAIPSYVRTRIPPPAKTLQKTEPAQWNASTDLAVWSREDDSPTEGRTMRDIFSHVSREDLSDEEEATLDDFLASAASVGYLGGGPKATIRGYTVKDVQAETMAKVVASNALCTALFDAAEHLSAEDIMASEWIVRQVSQTLGQERVGQKLQDVGPVPTLAS